MFTNLLNQYLGKLTELGKSDAPQLYDFIEESTRALGIKPPISVVRSHTKMPNMLMGTLKTPSEKEKLAIFVTDGMTDLLNGGSLKNAITDEFKAAIGHELSHHKDGIFLSKDARELAVVWLPIACVGAYYLLDKAWHKTENKKHPKQALSSLHQVIGEEKQALQKDDPASTKQALKIKYYDRILRASGLVAAAAVGLAAGLGVARHLSFSAEFRADRTGALLAENPEAMGSAIKKIMHALSAPQTLHFMPSQTSPTAEKAVNEMMQRVQSYCKNELMMLDLEYMHAHPTLEQRLSALRNIRPKKLDFRERLAESAAAATLDRFAKQ